MIICHKYKFIFVKTRKTAGTSVEIALARWCGAGDVVTPLKQADEKVRAEVGAHGPSNTRVHPKYYTAKDFAKLAGRFQIKEHWQHGSAEDIRACFPASVWNNYFKFCFERDPFDKAISRYFWSTREPRPEIGDYLDQAPRRHLSNWELYTSNDHVEVDFVGRYENLAADLDYVRERVGIPETIELPRAKADSRNDRRHYSEWLNENARRRIEVACAREIRYFGYQWNEESD